jgi:hypothetical protein
LSLTQGIIAIAVRSTERKTDDSPDGCCSFGCPGFRGDDAMSQRTFYADAIDTEIAQSRQMASLMTSRSANLRQKGHREASKAIFMETHRDKLYL